MPVRTISFCITPSCAHWQGFLFSYFVTVLLQFYFVACFQPLGFVCKPRKNNTPPAPFVWKRLYHAKPHTFFMAFVSLSGEFVNMGSSWEVWNSDCLIQRWPLLCCLHHVVLSFLILLLEKNGSEFPFQIIQREIILSGLSPCSASGFPPCCFPWLRIWGLERRKVAW